MFESHIRACDLFEQIVWYDGKRRKNCKNKLKNCETSWESWYLNSDNLIWIYLFFSSPKLHFHFSFGSLYGLLPIRLWLCCLWGVIHFQRVVFSRWFLYTFLMLQKSELESSSRKTEQLETERAKLRTQVEKLKSRLEEIKVVRLTMTSLFFILSIWWKNFSTPPPISRQCVPVRHILLFLFRSLYV